MSTQRKGRSLGRTWHAMTTLERRYVVGAVLLLVFGLGLRAYYALTTKAREVQVLEAKDFEKRQRTAAAPARNDAGGAVGLLLMEDVKP